MPIQHTVVPGDSVIRLAERHGLFADTIWNHPANSTLRARRSHMNELLPGDVITIPDRRTGSHGVPTGSRHRFRRRGIPAKFRLQVVVHGAPRANAPYSLIVDGVARDGHTDSDGVLEEPVPSGASAGELIVGLERLRVQIDFGHLPPASELAGVQHRLRNLGYTIDDTDGELGESTRAALVAFQSDCDLPQTGEPDEATHSRLDQVHSSAGHVGRRTC